MAENGKMSAQFFSPLSSLFRDWLLGGFSAKQSQILHEVEKLMTAVTDLAAAVTDVKNTLVRARDEIVAKIAALEDALSSVELPEDAETALAELRSAAQALDDIVPTPPTDEETA